MDFTQTFNNNIHRHSRGRAQRERNAAAKLHEGDDDKCPQHYVLTDAWHGYSVVIVEQHLESSGDGAFPGAATNKKMKTKH